MSWRTLEPPVDPPNPRMMECNQCDGAGKIEPHDEPERECYECEGSGEMVFDPDDDPYAPDNWKEAEGIA